MNCFFNLPDLTFWSTSVRWWIHDDRIVVISTADLTFYKFHTVIYQPADRCFRKSGCSCIFFGPGNHTLGSVYVCNLCTGSGSSQSCTACVSKKIQDFDRASGFTNFITEPVPVDSLLREKTSVFETEWFQMKSKILVMKIPLLWEIKKFPFTAAFFASVVVSIHVFPSTAYLWGVPDHLWVRAYQCVFSPAFKFFTAGSVNYFVFFPVICNPHI